MLTRADVRSSVEEFLRRHERFRGCYLCQLGGPRDSSAIITYYAQDLAGGCDVKVVPLQEALTEEDRPILFVDDFLGTGRQALSIVKNWLGEPYPEQLDEDHGRTLPALLAEILKRRQLGFAFVLGTQAGKDRLAEELARSAVQATVHVHQDEAWLPRAFGENGVRYTSPEAGRQFEARVRDIGAKLLTHQYGGRWDAEKIGERASERQPLLPSGVPVQRPDGEPHPALERGPGRRLRLDAALAPPEKVLSVPLAARSSGPGEV